MYYDDVVGKFHCNGFVGVLWEIVLLSNLI